MQTIRRDDISNFIKANPGYYFRELQRSLKLPTGVLQYHLNNLIKDGDVVAKELNGKTCYFPSRSFTSTQFIIFSHLRDRVRNKILRSLLSGESRAPSEIIKDLRISPPTLSYHLSLLVRDGLLERIQIEKGIGYRIKDLELFKGIIIEYKESFLDKLIQDFITVWTR
ncbi:MAG: ArsR family transcriptional regulator [Candidatus Thermoplasmatota archaeon]|nr:ArsR family transcriptional regulator [Candidatus Thermoplasmatota archaeon]